MIDKEKKVIKIGLKSFIIIAVLVVIIGAIGVSFYAKSKGKPNLISSIETLVKNEDDKDEIAKALFEEGMLTIRDSYRNYAGNGDTEKIGNNYYVKAKISYEKIKEEYSEIFIGEALEGALNLDFYNTNGTAYIVARAGGTPWEIVELNVERTNESEDELTYKAIYKLRYSDDPAGKQPKEQECQFKIKKVDGEYRISETNYLGIDKIQKISEQTNNVELGNSYKNDMGISFNYPNDWKLLDNGSGSISVGLSNPKTNEYDEYDEVSFTIQWLSNDVNTTPKQYIEEGERVRGSYDEKGNITFGDYQGYYCVGDFYQRENFNYKTIYVTVNSSMYEIRFGGNIALYNKYYATFEEMLETIKFTPSANSSNQTDDNTNNNNTSNNNTNNKSETNTNTATQNENILLGNNYKNNLGISFNYPGDWKLLDNGSGDISVGSKEQWNDKQEYIGAMFRILAVKDEDRNGMTLKQYYTRVEGEYDRDIKKEEISVAGKKGYGYISKGLGSIKYICLEANSNIYEITCRNYDKFSETYEAILKTLKFSAPTNTNNIGKNN